MTQEHTEEQQQYLCPQCESDDLAAEAVEHKTAYIGPDGDIHDERGGHTDFESFRCIDCGHQWADEDELDRAIRSMAAAGEVVSSRLTRAEESMYYAVLDALQAQNEEN